MASNLLITGTNLNTPMVTDLAKANVLYVEQEQSLLDSIVEGAGTVLEVIGDFIKINLEALMNAVVKVVGFVTDLLGFVKDKILALIGALLGRDLGGLSKLSLFGQSELGNVGSGGCGLGGNMNLGGFNLSLLGYSLASLLAMLLCSGVTAVFSLLDTIIDTGMTTIGMVTGAISDVLKSITGGNSIGVINDLANSRYADSVNGLIPNSSNMLLNSINNNTSSSIMSMGTPYQSGGTYASVDTSLNKLSPNWLKDNSGNFSLQNLKGNSIVPKLASKSLLGTESKPLLASFDYSGKTLSSTQKVSALSKLFG